MNLILLGFKSWVRLAENLLIFTIFFYFTADVFTKRSPFDMPRMIANITGMNYIFHQTIEYQGGQYGIAVLCKHNIIVC